MGFLENVIAFFSPSVALKRQSDSLRLEAVKEAKRSFDGATKGRRGEGWKTIGEGDPNTDITRDLSTLAARSANLYKNNPYAKKAIKTISLNVIGSGIRPAPTSKTAKTTETVKSEWKKWAESKSCDFYGRVHFYALQVRAMRQIALKGEVLVVKRRTNDKNKPLKIQLLSADYLDMNRSSIMNGTTENYTLNGVEYNPDGQVVAYWLFTTPPTNVNNLQMESKRFDAREVLHIYDEEILGQGRGVPFLAASMMRFRDGDDLEDAHLVREKIAACYTAFVTETPSTIAVQSEAQKLEDERVEPGMIKKMAPGESVTFGTPPLVDGIADYLRKVHQAQAAGVGISYEQMTGDLSNVNFSSGRMGWIEAQRQFEDWQYNLFIPMFCDGVWEWFLEALKISGKIKDETEISVSWTPPRREMIDPVKEGKGIESALKTGLTSWSEAVREQGYEPDDLLAQMATDKAKLEALGIPFEWLMGKQAKPQENNSK